jgi:hypothetical protein
VIWVVLGLGLGIGGVVSRAETSDWSTMQHVRIFVDFWNFHIAVGQLSSFPIEVDWKWFGLRAAQAIGETPDVHLRGPWQCEGTHIYGSYTTSKRDEHQLAIQYMKKLALIPGIFPVFEERNKSAATRTCGNCGKSVSFSHEQGIDVRLAVDVVKFSSFQPETIIMLATNDGDFIPLADYLTGLGRKVVHLRPKKGNEEISQKCWANVPLDKLDRSAFPFKRDTMVLMCSIKIIDT